MCNCGHKCKEVMCEVCKIKLAQIRDYRLGSSYLVCKDCLMIRDDVFAKTMKENKDK